VVPAGRDRRAETRQQEKRLRRWLSNTLGTALLAGAILVPMAALLVLLGYAVKRFLGLDINPNVHLMDMLR
jgi:hypothetical protein